MPRRAEYMLTPKGWEFVHKILKDFEKQKKAREAEAQKAEPEKGPEVGPFTRVLSEMAISIFIEPFRDAGRRNAKGLAQSLADIISLYKILSKLGIDLENVLRSYAEAKSTKPKKSKKGRARKR